MEISIQLYCVLIIWVFEVSYLPFLFKLCMNFENETHPALIVFLFCVLHLLLRVEHKRKFQFPHHRAFNSDVYLVKADVNMAVIRLNLKQNNIYFT